MQLGWRLRELQVVKSNCGVFSWRAHIGQEWASSTLDDRPGRPLPAPNRENPSSSASPTLSLDLGSSALAPLSLSHLLPHACMAPLRWVLAAVSARGTVGRRSAPTPARVGVLLAAPARSTNQRTLV